MVSRLRYAGIIVAAVDRGHFEGIVRLDGISRYLMVKAALGGKDAIGRR